jgi:uncharacterized lipoprotein YmbA
MMSTRTPFLILALGFAWLAAGCSVVPEAKVDPTKFYLLSSGEVKGGGELPPNPPIIRLRPVELANYLKARPMIVRRGDNEIEFREYARWGEPLDLGLARVLRERLLASHVARMVTGAVVKPAEGDRVRDLTIRVLSCEGGADGSVRFHAVWEISDATSKVLAQGDFNPPDLKWNAKTEDTLAAALSEAARGLASEIAAALRG